MPKSLLRTLSVGFALTSTIAFSQTAPAPLAFEVASVKPVGPLNPGMMGGGKINIGMKVDAARVDIGSLSLADLIRIAYRVKPYQISGPSWMGVERFNIQGRIPDGATAEQVPEMLQALLAERFKLTIHRESKEHAVYALVVGKGGPKLKESPPDAPAPAPDSLAKGSQARDLSKTEPSKTELSINNPPAKDPAAKAPGKPEQAFAMNGGAMRVSGDMQGKGMLIKGGPNGTSRMTMTPGGNMLMEMEKVTLTTFADMISGFVDRPVLDMTELKGTYQVSLELSMEELKNRARMAGVNIPGAAAGATAGPAGEGGRPADAASDPSGLSIFSSVQRLGLKLEPRKAPVDLIVIDHLEKMPTEN